MTLTGPNDDGDWAKKLEAVLLPLSSKQLCVKGYNILSLLHPGGSHYDKGARTMVVTLYLQNRLQQYGSNKSGYHDFNCHAWMTNVKATEILPKFLSSGVLLRMVAALAKPLGPLGVVVRLGGRGAWSATGAADATPAEGPVSGICRHGHICPQVSHSQESHWQNKKPNWLRTENCCYLMTWRLWDATKLLTLTKPSVWSKQIARRHWLLRPGGSFQMSLFNL